MITQYLLEAYRRLEMAANRDDYTVELKIAFESALADIQLLGSNIEISKAIEFMKAHASKKGATIDQLLCQLRNDLREELELPPIDNPPTIFRFIHN